MSNPNLEPIAVIGIAVKFPQEASTTAGFWDLLLRGGSARTEVPADRYNAEAFQRVDGIKAKTGTIKTRHGHFIAESLDRFDAPFFSITPHEAECMDPQQRWLLESTYHALENAGLTLDQVNGSSTSVHVGCFMNDHETMVYKDLEMPNTYQSTGNASALLANRISWFYNLSGPSMSVNTACSGSLVALHLACQSLRAGETTMGLVCGSNLIFAPETTVGLSNLNLLSPNGKCYSFDERANGYARGEGIASLVIKPLSSAIQDGDNIRALIRGTGVNSDGRTPGIIKPSSDAQIALIHDTYRRFGLDLSLTRYFEAHATGTQVGDPLEAKTIATVFNQEQRGDSPLFVGALKTNIGHLEGASGIAGVIKTIMVLEHSLIPPNIWLDKVNPAIKEEWGLTFPTGVIPFPSAGIRRASVNSFGFGGTNAHVILDDAETFLKNQDFQGDWPRQPQKNSHQDIGVNPILKLLTWSAADENGIERLREAYNTHFLNSPYDEIGDCEEGYLEKLAYTLGLRRTHLPWRTFSICGSSKDLYNLELVPATRTNPRHQMCYIFTGQGAQWTKMGQGLLSYECYRQSMEHSDAILRDMGCQFSILEKLYEQCGSNDSELDHPEFCQPINTALQVALVELLASWGIEPSIVIGHSSGEIAAAFCAGLVTKLNALKLAFFRGVAVGAALQINPRRGGMMTVRLSPESCEEMLSRHSKLPDPLQQPVQIACYNSAHNVTLSGDRDEIQRLEPLFESEGIPARKLNASIAYHNAQHMQTAASLYRTFIDDLSSNTFDNKKLPISKCFFVSTVNGKILEPGLQSSEVSKPDYWTDNLLSPVRFTDAVQKVESLLNIKDALLDTHFVEIGPHSTMKSAIKEALSQKWSEDKCYSSMLLRQQPAMLTSLTVAGRLHCLGYPINLEAINHLRLAKRRGGFLYDLPPYPFDHLKSRWLESRASKNYRLRSVPYHDFLGTPSQDWNPLEPQWNDRIILQEKPFIKDHKISGSYLYPAAGMLVMAIEAVRQLGNSNRQPSGYRFKNVEFSGSLVVPETHQGIETQFRLQQNERLSNLLATCYEFRLYMCDHGVWTQCCRGVISVEFQKIDLDRSQRVTEKHKETWQMRRSLATHNDFYANLRSSGLQYGPNFQIVDQICYGDGNTGIADINIQRYLTLTSENIQSTCLIHPAALDCILQTAFIGISQGGNVGIPALVPTAIKELWISADSQHSYSDSVVEVFAQPFSEQPRSHSVNYISLWKNDHQPFLLGDLTFRTFGGATPSLRLQEDQVSLYHIKWKPHVDLLLSKDCSFSSDRKHPRPENTENVRLTEHVCLLAMSEVLEAINLKEFSNSDRPVHIKKYLAWMNHEVTLRKNSNLWVNFVAMRQEGPESLEQLLRKVGSLGPEGKVIVRLYKALLQIVQGNLDPLHILFSDNTLVQYYRLENPPPEVTSGIQKYVDCMAHLNLGLRVLEIGAGTGGMTKGILDIIGGTRSAPEEEGDERPRFSEYMFTDVSPAFFKAATEQFGRNGFICKTFNVEKDPEEQGFSTGFYDLVIASNVLHATRSLFSTLRNTRKLLKPGGKLILVEGISSNFLRTSFIFGCLTGWWLSSEPFREWGPLVSAEKWNQLLLENQFTGTDFIIEGVDKSTALSGAMISTACKHHSDEHGHIFAMPSVTVVRTETSVLQHSLASSIKNMGIQLGAQVGIADNPQETAGAVCVLLKTMDKFSFVNPSRKEFSALKTTLQSAKNLLWVTTQQGSSESETHQQSAILGLSRSILSETEGLNIVTLRLQDAKNTERATQHIWAVLRQYFKTTKATHTHFLNEEVVEIDEVLCVSRLQPAKGLETQVQSLKTQYRLSRLEQNVIDNHVLGHKKSKAEIKVTGQHQDISTISANDAQPVIPDSINNASPPTTTKPTHSGAYIFHSQATYIITGGLGGLGKSIAKWMVSSGAQNILLLSRQGGEISTAEAFLDDLKAHGVTVFAPKCDIADYKDVQKTLQEVTNHMPPIRGCIQASMVLQSAMFQNMTLEQWTNTLRSKVQGSSNLHRQLTTDLDFFILLSSLCGIVGASGQSNYAFGCAYQDALAQHRVGMGQRGISIDLGIIEGVGYTAEHQGVSYSMRSMGMQYISEEYLHALLGYYCDPGNEVRNVSEAQVVVGIMTEEEMRGKGLAPLRVYMRPLMMHLKRITRSVGEQRSRHKTVKRLPMAAAAPGPSSDQRRNHASVTKAICERLSDMLDLRIEDISPEKALHTFGVDSLVAMEIRSWFKVSIGADVAVFDILSNISIDGLVVKIIGEKI